MTTCASWSSTAGSCAGSRTSCWPEATATGCDATRTRRAALDALAGTALEVIGEQGTAGVEAHRDEVLATLEAASLEPDAGAALLAGRLTTALAPSPGFGLLGGSSLDASTAPPSLQTEAPRERGNDERARAARLAEAREVAADARTLADQRRAEATTAAQEATAARRVAVAAEEEMARLTRTLEGARRSATEAAGEARRAADRAAEAERVAAAAETQAVAAGTALARLDAG